MFDIAAGSPFPAFLFPEPLDPASPDGPWGQVLVVKVTFDLEPGVCRTSAHHDPINHDLPLLDGDGSGRVYCPSDRVLYKPRAEVLLVGSIRGPTGDKAGLLCPRLMVGDIDETTTLSEDRLWLQARMGREGAFLRSDERIVLDHLHRDHPRLVTALPGIEVRATVRLVDYSPVDLPLRADTLWIELDRRIATVTWRGVFNREKPTSAEARLHLGTVTVRAARTTESAWDPAEAPPATGSTGRTVGAEWIERRNTASRPGGTPGGGADGEAGSPMLLASGPPTPLDATAASNEAARRSHPDAGRDGSRGATSANGRPVVQLVWCEETIEAVIRGRRQWTALLAEQALSRASTDLAEGLAPARRAALDVLVMGGPDDMASALASAGDDGVTPWLLEGRFELTFDVVDWLRTAVRIAKPLMGSDIHLGEAIARAEAHLTIPGIQSCTGLLAELRTRLESAFAAMPGGWSRALLATCCERALLEERQFARRRILGGTWLRAALSRSGAGGEEVAAYLPDSMVASLPLLASHEARVLASVVPRQDALEPREQALRVLALGRRLS